MHAVAKETEVNRFEQIRKAAAEKRRKSDTNGTQRPARQSGGEYSAALRLDTLPRDR
jgi:hypothetical protein